MNSNAKAGTERPHTHSPAEESGGRDYRDIANEAAELAFNDPEAEALLRRYLAEVHGRREAGNAALRELENRLVALSRQQPEPRAPQAQASQRMSAAPVTSRTIPAAEMSRPAAPRQAPFARDDMSLTERLRELTSYLHEDLSQREASQAGAPVEPEATITRHTFQAQRAPAPRTAPSAPVLDRAWFEARFAAMRASIDEIAEHVPSKRLEALEGQFRQLMERLDSRDAAQGGVGQLENSLKRLAVYLEDSNHWAASQDRRMRDVEDKLSHLSGLVAQSHAAISATAKGLEIIARSTGSKLASATADLVVDRLDEKIARLNTARPIEDLNREVASLAMQSRQYARNTDERLKQLQASLSENAERQATTHADNGGQNGQSKSAASNPTDTAEFLSSKSLEGAADYDSELIVAAQRAARLAEGEKPASASGESLRYQIPYNEFLPEDERRNSHVGLFVAAVILLLASAAMLYLNLRDKDVFGYIQRTFPVMSAAPSAGDPVASVPVPANDASVGETVMPKLQSADRAGQPLASLDTPAGVTFSDGGTLQQSRTAAPGSLISTDPLTPAPSTGKGAANAKAADTDKAASMREAAVKGDLEAQFHVGQSYLAGRDAEQALERQERLSRAVRWFRRAAESGHAPSQYRLATLYELGQGAPKDLGEAAQWYQRAAEGGHLKAMHNLGVLSIQAQSNSYATAVKWFTAAAERGLTDSQYNLALLYERGLGVQQDTTKAFFWYALAAQRGDAKATQKRDALTRTLSAEKLTEVAQLVGGWSSLPADALANGNAPEPPVNEALAEKTAVKAEEPRAQIMKASWTTTVMTRDPAVADVQRLLKSLGHNAGPADGILGQRTVAAIREFEAKNGMPVTGQVSEVLTARLAFSQK